jgi:nicotinate-nucleotide pyrophosphorylase
MDGLAATRAIRAFERALATPRRIPIVMLSANAMPHHSQEAIAAGAEMVLLDNMTPDAVRACVSLARGTAPSGFLVEVSGGVTLDTVRSYADAGADLISTSVITQSAPALDLAFDLRPASPSDGRAKER